jgi:hypothetical protein
MKDILIPLRIFISIGHILSFLQMAKSWLVFLNLKRCPLPKAYKTALDFTRYKKMRINWTMAARNFRLSQRGNLFNLRAYIVCPAGSLREKSPKF